jgi:hypothetical protein
MQDIARQFATWVGKQDPTREYDYCSNGECAFAQFLGANGYANEPNVSPGVWSDAALDSPVDHCIPTRVEEAVAEYNYDLPNGGRTFGALATRLADQAQ